MTKTVSKPLSSSATHGIDTTAGSREEHRLARAIDDAAAARLPRRHNAMRMLVRVTVEVLEALLHTGLRAGFTALRADASCRSPTSRGWLPILGEARLEHLENYPVG